ncbi:MAG: VanZ family protein [Myxococcota bacterium]
MPPTLHRSVWTAIYYVPFLILCGIIFWLSSMSNPPIPEPMRFPGADKILHGIAFAAVGAAAALGSMVRRNRLGLEVFLEAWILTAIYGFLDEVHQRFTPSRSSDITDWFADIIGAAVGVLLFSAAAKAARWVAKR